MGFGRVRSSSGLERYGVSLADGSGVGICLSRGRSKRVTLFGDDEASLGEFAWFGGNSDSRTHEVGQKRQWYWPA